MREVKIEEYWPLIVKGTEEFGQIAVAENPEFNELSRCVYQVLKESFLLDGEEEHASEYGVSRWEKMLGLSHSADMSLDDRKAAILTYLSVKLPYTWRVLKQMLVGLLGEGNFELTFDNDAQKITIALASTVEHLREQIDSLIERVVPQNLVFEYDNGLPIDFERVDFLESTGTQRINTNIIPTNKSGFKLALTYIHGQGNDNKTNYVFGCQTRSGGEAFHVCLNNERVGISLSPTTIFYNKKRLSQLDKFEISVNYKNDSVYYVDGEDAGVLSVLNYTPIFYIWLFRSSFKSNTSFDPSYPVRVWSCEMTEGEATIRNYVPALDDTGCPCMFDLVTRTPFYNSGTGDFTYPTNAAPAISADLDETFYAKLTEHGIRRLYHVPQGYTGSKDKYAAEHGYKELVEPPMPAEGYWAPEWRETDTHIILEWVETEPPMEVTEND